MTAKRAQPFRCYALLLVSFSKLSSVICHHITEGRFFRSLKEPSFLVWLAIRDARSRFVADSVARAGARQSAASRCSHAAPARVRRSFDQCRRQCQAGCMHSGSSVPYPHSGYPPHSPSHDSSSLPHPPAYSPLASDSQS